MQGLNLSVVHIFVRRDYKDAHLFDVIQQRCSFDITRPVDNDLGLVASQKNDCNSRNYTIHDFGFKFETFEVSIRFYFVLKVKMPPPPVRVYGIFSSVSVLKQVSI